MEKIDILLATYNGEKYLEAQLNSILSQTYSNFRLIVSDDFSSDSTRDILNRYKEKDNRIILYFQEENLGVVKNFEFLLNKVENKYYMLSDQDDIWKKDKIEKSLNTIEETGAGLVYSDLEVVDKDLNVIYESYWKLKGFTKRANKYNTFESLYLNNYITGCTMISRKEFIKDILPLPNISKYVLHDYWISLIVSQKTKIVSIKEPLIKYRQHKNNNIGSKRKSDELNSLKEIRKLFIDVKKEHFTVFIENEDRFKDEKIKNLNRDALSYFEMLEKTKHINLKKWGLFFKLYKYENFMYKIKNFIILNMPGLFKLFRKY